MSRLSNWLLITILLISPCFGQGLADYTLKRGVGVRAAGMGSAYTAVADDASSVFYNPAGLAEPGFAYTYGDPDTEQRSINGSFELLKMAYLGYGSWSTQLNTDEAKVTALSFGNRSGWINWGLTYKTVAWTLNGVQQEGWTSDIGFLVRVTPQLRLGFLAQDLFTS